MKWFPKAVGLWKHTIFYSYEVQGLGPWRVWAEPSLSYLRACGAKPLAYRFTNSTVCTSAITANCAPQSMNGICQPICGTAAANSDGPTT